jgi:hypothetical protein
MAKTARSDSAREAALRDWTKFLALWRVCDNAGCRRSHACRGNVRACAPANFARAPEGVKAWFAMMLRGKQDGLSFDELLERLDGTAAEAAFLDWHTTGARCPRPDDCFPSAAQPRYEAPTAT